jgi:hypothetical protein
MNQEDVRKLARTRAAERNIPWDDSALRISRPLLGRFLGQWRLTSLVKALGAQATMIMILDAKIGQIVRLRATNLQMAAIIHLQPTGAPPQGSGGWRVLASSLAVGVVAMLFLYAASEATAIPMALRMALACVGGCVAAVAVLGLWVRRELRRAVDRMQLRRPAPRQTEQRGPRS